MATIDYTRRSVRLENLGTPKGVMAPIVPDFMAGVDRSGAWERAYARQGRAWDEIAGAGAKIGKAAIELDALLQSRENDRLLSKAAGMVMELNDEALTSMKQDDDGRPVGLLNRLGEDCRDLPREGHDRLNETVDAVAKELELSDSQVELLHAKLSPYAFSCMGRLRARRTSEIGRIQVEEAKALCDRDVATIAFGNGTDDMYETALGDFENYMRMSGVQGTAAANARRGFAEKLFEADVKRTVAGLGSERAFDAAIAAAEERPESLFMGNEVLKREMGGKVGTDLHASLLKDMRNERDRFLGRKRHEESIAREELKDQFVRKELEATDKNLPATEWVQFYRDLGSDENLRTLAPDTALKYMETAERLDGALKRNAESEAARISREADEAAKKAEREAAQAARQEIAATEGGLAGRLLNLEIRELDGDAGLQGGQLAAEQAAIWRDYKVALHSGKMRENFASTFLGRLKNRLSDQERGAMRQFYAAFGYHGDLASDGDVTAADRKAMKKDVFMSPADETQAPTSDDVKGRKLTGEQLFSLGDTFLREMRTMGPEAYRPEVIRTVIGEIKTRHMAEDFNRNRAELAQKLLNIQRNFKAGEIQNGRGNDNGNGGGNGTGGARSGREDD